MPKNSDNRSIILSIRFNEDEYARLEHDAAGLALGAYVRYRVFDESLPKRHTRGKFPVKDHKMLGRLLGDLGRSLIANNLNQIVKAINSGVLLVTPEIQIAILDACAAIAEMKAMLIKALGLNGE